MAKRRSPRRTTRKPAGPARAPTAASPARPAPAPRESGDVAGELERTLAAGCRAVREGKAFTAHNLEVLRLAKEYVFTRAKLDLERQAIELGDAAGDGLPAGFDPLGALKVRARDG